MIYYFQKLVGVLTFPTKIQTSEGNSTTLKNWIQKLEGKPTTVKLGNKERFDKEQIGVKEPFPVTNCQFTS
jgi:hypothetical protein